MTLSAFTLATWENIQAAINDAAPRAGVATLTGTGAAFATTTVPFATPFTATPVVTLAAFSNTGLYVADVYAIGASSFGIAIRRFDGAAIASGTGLTVEWIATPATQ